MMSELLHFKVSSGLKNIIGKELINDKFIAIFELVKNSYDAGAKSVVIRFTDIYGENPQISIIDNGNGMSKKDILDKWLFVAYSEKKYSTYRDNLIKRRNYAGAKGVGRFSCDRLGETVELYSKTNNEINSNLVKINWNDFEQSDSEEFQNIKVSYDSIKNDCFDDSGAIILINNLREQWNRSELLQLKKALTQLVNPDANDNYDKFDIFLDVEEEQKEDDRLLKKKNEKGFEDDIYDKDIVNGKIVNHVFEILNVKTTKITAEISEDGKKITTTLNDRGIQLFKIEEKNRYNVKDIKGTLYSLNRAAKINFTKIMGTESVNYGSVFIYKNGFRVFPYGEPEKDFMNIDRRKAQGYKRYLGTREISGRIDIFGTNEGFIETSSRNNGFISSSATEELENFFYEYLLKPLEKYVVNIIHWGEEVVDNESLISSINGYEDLESVLKKIKSRFKTETMLNAEYNQELTKIIAERRDKKSSDQVEELKKIAREREDLDLIEQAFLIEKETKKLEKQIEENRKVVQREIDEHEQTKQELEVTQKQVGVLQSRVDISADTAIDAMHIMKAYADTIDSDIEEILEIVREGLDINEVTVILHEIRQTCSKIMNAYNLVINTEYNADTGNRDLDIVKFTKTYVEKQWNHKFKIVVQGVEKMNIKFNPLEFSIIIDNIADNSRKANSNVLYIDFVDSENGKIIIFKDDGYGISCDNNIGKLCEQGYTTTNGTGIGLYTVKNYINKMNGTVYINSDYKDGFELQARF
jgi:signal transduction histidine kinase